MENIIQYFRKEFLTRFDYLRSPDWDLLFTKITFETLKKGDAFIGLDQRSWKVGFVLDGVIRGYHLKDGKEKTVFFAAQSKLVAAYNTIIFDEPSTVTYHALSDEVLMCVLDWHEMQKLFEQNFNLERMSKDMILHALGEVIRRTESQLLETPEERYLRFLKEQADILHTIPQKYIASYIGVTPVSLSRIRKRMMKS